METYYAYKAAKPEQVVHVSARMGPYGRHVGTFYNEADANRWAKEKGVSITWIADYSTETGSKK